MGCYWDNGLIYWAVYWLFYWHVPIMTHWCAIVTTHFLQCVVSSSGMSDSVAVRCVVPVLLSISSAVPGHIIAPPTAHVQVEFCSYRGWEEPNQGTDQRSPVRPSDWQAGWLACPCLTGEELSQSSETNCCVVLFTFRTLPEEDLLADIGDVNWDMIAYEMVCWLWSQLVYGQ